MAVLHKVIFFSLLVPFMLNTKRQTFKKKNIFVSDCCLNSNVQIVSYILIKTSYIRWDENDIRFIPTLIIGYVFLVHCVPSGEVTNSNFILDYLTRTGGMEGEGWIYRIEEKNVFELYYCFKNKATMCFYHEVLYLSFLVNHMSALFPIVFSVII
jgi:hypothetical protein